MLWRGCFFTGFTEATGAGAGGAGCGAIAAGCAGCETATALVFFEQAEVSSKITPAKAVAISVPTNATVGFL